MFIQTVSEAEAEGKLRELYEGDQQSLGYVPNHAKVFSLRPDVLQAWRGLQGASARTCGCAVTNWSRWRLRRP